MGQITKQIKGKIIFKHGTEADWNLSNYKPDNGEQVLYDPDDGHPYTRIKYGDGENFVKDLPFAGLVSDSEIIVGNNITGRKGYYYSHIDTTNRKIYLTKEQPKYGSLPTLGAGTIDTTFETPAWRFKNESGEDIEVKLSIVNSAKQEDILPIVSVENNVITWAEGYSFPWTQIYDETNGGTNELEADDYSVSVIDQPEIGLVELKSIFVAIGSGNSAAGNDSLTFGRRNVSYGDYSLTTGKNNRAGHCSTAMGVNNDVLADYALSVGGDNIIDHGGDKSIVAGDNNYVNGAGNLVVGEDNSPIDDNSGESREAGVYGNKNVVAGSWNKVTKDENLIGGHKNIVTADRNIIGGTDNTIDAPRNLTVGRGNIINEGEGRNIIGGL